MLTLQFQDFNQVILLNWAEQSHHGCDFGDFSSLQAETGHTNYFGPTTPGTGGLPAYFRLLKRPLTSFTEETYFFMRYETFTKSPFLDKCCLQSLNKNGFVVHFHYKIVQIYR